MRDDEDEDEDDENNNDDCTTGRKHLDDWRLRRLLTPEGETFIVARARSYLFRYRFHIRPHR